jgi:hypothetical protein
MYLAIRTLFGQDFASTPSKRNRKKCDQFANRRHLHDLHDLHHVSNEIVANGPARNYCARPPVGSSRRQVSPLLAAFALKSTFRCCWTASKKSKRRQVLSETAVLLRHGQPFDSGAFAALPPNAFNRPSTTMLVRLFEALFGGIDAAAWTSILCC